MCRRPRAGGPAGGDPVHRDDELDRQRDWLGRSRLDPRTFEYFYVRYELDVFRYCLRAVRNEDDAHDLTRQTFLRAQLAFARFQWREINYRNYLIRIARNECLKWLQKRRRETLCADAGAHLADPAEGIEDQLDRHDLRTLVDAMLARLDPLTRELLNLRYRDDLSVRDIAQILQLNENTVKTKLHRGREALRRMLMGEGGLSEGDGDGGFPAA